MPLSECISCKGRLSYNEKYDSYFCELCNKWKEDKCGDDACHFCSDRPQKPSMENLIDND